MPRTLSPEKRTRYSRHLLIPEIGEEGQLKLLDARILLIGAGGLGSPASLYLAAAGIGTLGIIDADIVDETNLQRQIVALARHARHAEGRLREARDRGAQPRRRRASPTASGSPPRTSTGSSTTAGTSSSTAPTTSPRATSSTTPRSGAASRSSTARSTASRARSPSSSRTTARATAASSRSRRRPSSRRRAPRAACSACCPGIVGSLQTNEAIKLAAGIGEPLDRPPAALRRARDRVQRGEDRAPRRLPRLRRPPDDHRVHRLRGVLRAMSIVRVPPVLRAEAGGAREVEAAGRDGARAARGPRDAAAGARLARLRRGRDPARS